MDTAKLDFCPRCRQKIDTVLNKVPHESIYLRANHVAPPPEGHIVVSLCSVCGKFIVSNLKVDGFTIHTP